jgi:hypothetical protein
MTDELTNANTLDDIEGMDDGPAEPWGDYPLDTVLVRKDQRTVGDIVIRINKGRYKLDPEFQRDFVWNPVQQSRLIESSLMRIPLPVLYVAEDTEGKIIVVDGLQRLTTFLNYLNDEFALKGVGSGDPDSVITGKTFSQLPIHLQERIEDTQLTLYILDPKAPERARLDIFERVNSGVPLTRQQMRNCLYTGEATRWLKKAAAKDMFLKATGNALKVKSMRDREVINRFCAFYLLGYKTYRGDMEEFLGRALKQMNQMTAADIQVMGNAFIQSMKLSFELFGKHSFRKSLVRSNGDVKRDRSVINVSLFDALATVPAKKHKVIFDEDKEKLKRRIILLVDSTPFNDAISNSTNGTFKVQTRHRLLEKALEEIGIC